ncbi:hypothetical protein CPC08DRAFT_251087 [Agrocybe pediades]|nr:hypothetical protein CPC08DRAFT_251087 [Agrocybe pediades]
MREAELHFEALWSGVRAVPFFIRTLMLTSPPSSLFSPYFSVGPYYLRCFPFESIRVCRMTPMDSPFPLSSFFVPKRLCCGCAAPSTLNPFARRSRSFSRHRRVRRCLILEFAPPHLGKGTPRLGFLLMIQSCIFGFWISDDGALHPHDQPVAIAWTRIWPQPITPCHQLRIPLSSTVNKSVLHSQSQASTYICSHYRFASTIDLSLTLTRVSQHFPHKDIDTQNCYNLIYGVASPTKALSFTGMRLEEYLSMLDLKAGANGDDMFGDKHFHTVNTIIRDQAFFNKKIRVAWGNKPFYVIYGEESPYNVVWAAWKLDEMAKQTGMLLTIRRMPNSKHFAMHDQTKLVFDTLRGDGHNRLQ